MNQGIGVVAVGMVGHITGRLGKIDYRYIGIAVTVAVAVLIPGCAFIDLPVTVIVNAVTADFRGAGINQGIRIITVGIIGHIAARLDKGKNGHSGIAETVAVAVLIPGQAAFIAGAVTIVVPAVADFVRAGINTGITVITIRVVGHIAGRLGN